MSQSIDIFQQIAALRKRGEIDRALEVLREALRRGGLGPEEVDRAGRFLIKARAVGPRARGFAPRPPPGTVHHLLARPRLDRRRLGARSGLLRRRGRL